MNNFEIKITPKRLTNYSAHMRNSLDKETLSLIMRDFSGYIKSYYLYMIEENIQSTRYKGHWEPINDPGYIEYLGTTPPDDIIHIINDSLEAIKIGHNHIVRINPRMRYPKSNLTVIRVLRAIESGTSDFKARPLLRKVSRDINYHILDIWKGYLAKKGVW